MKAAVVRPPGFDFGLDVGRSLRAGPEQGAGRRVEAGIELVLPQRIDHWALPVNVRQA
jgi:hypothetical protein